MPIDATAKAALFSRQTEKIFLTLLTLSHADLPSPLRFVNNNENVTQTGPLVFSAFPFNVILPSSTANELAVATLIIDNVDRGITTSIRGLPTAPTIVLEVVMADDPDNVQLGPLNFTWRIAEWTALVVQGELRFEDVLSEPYPGDHVTPSLFPGVF